MHQDEHADDQRVALDPGDGFRMDKRVGLKAEYLGVNEPAAQHQRDHADQTGCAQQVSADAKRVPDRPCAEKDKVGDKGLQHIGQVRQQEIGKRPHDQGVRDAGQQSALEDGLLRDGNHGRVDQAADDVIRAQAARPAPDDAIDASGDEKSRVTGGTKGDDKEEFFDGSEHE